MFLGLDAIFILGYTIVAGAAAAANNNMNRNNNDRREPFHNIHTAHTATYHTPSYSSGSSSYSSSVHTNHDYFEKRTIWDWWCNGLDSEERNILLENGYSDRSGCFSLEELKSTSERMFAEKAPGKPTEKDGFKPKKGWDGKTVKAPDSKKRGYPDKDGNVWIPSGPGTGVHEPHWDVEKPGGGYDNVYPGGRIRPGKKH